MSKVDKVSGIDDPKFVHIKAYLDRIRAVPRGMRTAIIEQSFVKYWRDTAVISFSLETGHITLRNYKGEDSEIAPTEAEAAAIKEEILDSMKAGLWPKVNVVQNVPKLPSKWGSVPKRNMYVFRDRGGNVLMLQIRIDPTKDAEKHYIPLTWWDDGVWREKEPDGPLPIWGMENIKDNTTAFLHEGAKAASYVHWMCNDPSPEAKRELAAHPWGEALKWGVHLGWIGGALNPHRIDWAVLAKIGIQKVYIVVDNDKPGREAVALISQALPLPVYKISFDNNFVEGFDLADPFPDKLYGEIDGTRYWRGPTMDDCTEFATWLTDMGPAPDNPKRMIPYLRNHARESWTYVKSAELFVCTDFPQLRYPVRKFNAAIADLCQGTSEPSKLFLKLNQSKVERLAYRPGEGRFLYEDGERAINAYIPGTIRPRSGNIKPWMEFLEHLLPNEAERHQVMRWVATLIARPQVRMKYSLLMISKQTGVGKSILSEILAELVGKHNVSSPSEQQILGQFNPWAALKRLCVIEEIYQGHSWKMANVLKAVQTAERITVNRKNVEEHTVNCQLHIYASSNSLQALKLDDEDRRWYVPEITEFKWSKGQDGLLHRSLAEDGRFLYHPRLGDQVWRLCLVRRGSPDVGSARQR
jgi:hypothetical protein